MTQRSWEALSGADKSPAVVGHPQFGLKRLTERLGVTREHVKPLGAVDPVLAVRGRVISDAMRPAETTDEWLHLRSAISQDELSSALEGVSLLEAANEREEALAIAVALRLAISKPDSRAALVTADRNLARRVAAELLRFGIEADDSGGAPLANAPPAALLRILVRAAFEPEDPMRILSLIKHPLLHLGMPRAITRAAAEIVELVALRGGAGRPGLATLREHFDLRLQQIAKAAHKPNWFERLGGVDNPHINLARELLERLDRAIAPLVVIAARASVELTEITQASVLAMEALVRDEDASLTELYDKNAGEKLAEFLREIMAARQPFELAPSEWPDVLDALIAPVNVKPRVVDDNRVAIWGTLEARLQSVDTLVLGGLNEGSWPRQVRGDRFLSRMMRAGLNLPPPEREIGLAAHDFEMALGGRNVILSRSARSGDSPATPSRWLQRLLTFVGEKQAESLASRGRQVIIAARQLDEAPRAQSIPRAEFAPPLELRPRDFSITEIERLRRDPYAVYAQRVLRLQPLDPLIRDPSAADRGNLIHDILYQFAKSGVRASSPEAEHKLLDVGRRVFAEAALPEEIQEVWWPRFERMASQFVKWERVREPSVAKSYAEIRATRTAVGGTGVTLRGFADRIDLKTDKLADIIDYKTGSSPRKRDAHNLVAPQLALEAALLKRGAFEPLGPRDADDLLYVRLRANGLVENESVLAHDKSEKTAADMADEAWERLEQLLRHYADPGTPYRSRVLPFRESDMDGDYDHLARVLEWSAGALDEDDASRAFE
jgi:ATP-dependent helicase/nuclease subunit B